MDEMTQSGENVESTPVETGQEAAEVAETPEAVEAVPETDQPAETPEEGEADPDVVKDENGEEFIPKKAFEARIAKLTAQKHNAWNELLSSAASDPALADQLRQVLGAQSSAKTEEPPKDPVAQNLPLLDYLAKNQHVWDPKFKDQYVGFADAVGQTLLPQLQAMVEQRLSPMLTYIGKQEVDGFIRTHPDAKPLMPQMQQMISLGRATNLPDAYVLLTHASKVKGAGVAAVKSEKTRQEKLVSTPIKRGATVPGSTEKKPSSFREMLEMTAREKGFRLK